MPSGYRTVIPRSTARILGAMTRDDPDARAEAFWQGYLETLPVTERGRRYYEAFQFGRGREMVTQLTRLVLDGVKTATSDLLWQLEIGRAHV